MSVRIRQIVLAARDLAPVVEQFENKLGLRVVYRDPLVAEFGLVNALMRIGDQFVEVVAPVREHTAAGRHLERHGDSAYMLILQTDDLSRDRARVERLGVRVIWEATHSDMSAIQLHPKDIGAAIVSFDEPTPPDSWRWAGPNWQQEVSAAHAHRIVDATISARDPAKMARRWSEVLGLDPPRESEGKWRLNIEQGALKFIESADGAERIVEFGLKSATGVLPVVICGTTFAQR